MSGEELIDRYETLGFALTIERDGQLAVVGPRGSITEALLDDLRRQKDVLLEVLRAREHPASWMLVYSERLADLVVLAEPEVALPERLAGYVRYSTEEARKLEDCPDSLLAAVHATKRVFGGDVVKGPGGHGCA